MREADEIMISRECPFCGNWDIDIEQDYMSGGQGSIVYVVCRTCGARTKDHRVFYGQEPYDAIRQAAEQWNTRRRARKRPAKK